MNQPGSHPNHENHDSFKNIYEGSPLQGLDKARQGSSGFWENGKLKPPRKPPRGRRHSS